MGDSIAEFAPRSFQTAIVSASENGLKVTVEDSKCVQGNAFIQAGIFQDFNIGQENVTFKVNLTVLLVSCRLSHCTWVLFLLCNILY